MDIIKTQKETNMQFCLHIGCRCNMLGLVIGLILLEPTQQMLLLLELRTPKKYHHVTDRLTAGCSNIYHQKFVVSEKKHGKYEKNCNKCTN